MTMQAGAAGSAEGLTLFLRQVRYEGRNIQSYEFVDPAGGELPPFTAGAHLDIHLGDGLVRQYSLCNPPSERHRYVIAVLRDSGGRGGSEALHARLHVQDMVQASRPRNNFELNPEAERAILLAGGIGITPLKAMAHALQERGVDFDLHYCAKDAGSAAFCGDLGDLLAPGRLHLHFDGGKPEQGLDIAGLMADVPVGTHVYYCGPGGFMAACAKATAHWPSGTVHCEHFKAPAQPQAAARAEDGGFQVQIASTGQRLDVPPDRSIAQVLRDAGVSVETSCEAGLCATCKVRYLAGEVEHQDYVLDEDAQREYLTVCVSRAKSELLLLDL